MNADPENGVVDGAPKGRRRARERVTPPVSRHGDHCFCEVGPGMLRADAVTGPQGLTGTRHGGSYRQETKPGADGAKNANRFQRVGGVAALSCGRCPPYAGNAVSGLWRPGPKIADPTF